MKEFGPFRLDPVNQCLWRSNGSGEDERILLTPTEFGVLDYFVEHAGQLVTHDALLDAVWPRTAIEPQAVKIKVFHLRRVLGDDSKRPRFIETVQRRGYRFVAKIANTSPDDTHDPQANALLVGREQTLADLWRSWQAARNGRLELLFLTGEPGIGKTSVAEEFCQQVARSDRTVRVARGQCVEGFGNIEPFYPVLEAIGRLCVGPDGGRAIDTLASRAPTWLVQFPALLTDRLRETLKQEILGATRERMLREVADALENIARVSPLLIVLEDLHWADPSTLDLVSALARHRAPARIMLLATYRSTDLSRSMQPLHALKRDLVARKLCREIVLEPLTEDDIVQYLEARGAPGDAAREIASLLHRTTEGNPLFVTAVLERLLEQRIIEPERGWRFQLTLAENAIEVPESLRQMIVAQIEALSEDEQRVLEVGSIAGMSFAPVICAPTLDMDVMAFDETCDTLARRGQVVRLGETRSLPDGAIVQRYDFVHALYREVLYQRQSPARRAMLHRRRAERMEEVFRSEVDDVTPELAHQFEMGADWARAVRYRRRAAELAVRRCALEEARANLQRALDLAGHLPPTVRPMIETEILASLSEMDVVTFDNRAVETLSRLREQAARYGIVEAEARALVNLVLPLAWSDGAKALEVIDEALNVSDRALDPHTRARIRAACMHRRISVRGWSTDDFLECDRAMEEIRREGTPADIAWHEVDCTFLNYYRAEYRRAHQQATASLDALMKGDDTNTYLNYAVAHWNCDIVVPWSLNLLGEWGTALRELDTRIARAERNGDTHRKLLLLLSQIRVQLNALNFGSARTTGLSLLPALQRGSEDPLRRLCLIVIGAAEAGLREFDAALQHLLMAREEMDGRMVIADWYHRLMLQWALTNLFIARGDLVRARAEGALFATHAAATVERTWRSLAWEANARIALALGDAQEANELSNQATTEVEGIEAPVAGWQAHATAAQVSRARGDTAAAARHAERCRENVRALGASLDGHRELQQTFLSAPPVRQALAGNGRHPGFAPEPFMNQRETAR